MVKVLVCSTCILEKVMGPPLRGLVHSAFAPAVNLSFSDGFLLSVNASGTLPDHSIPQSEEERGLLLPNGLLLSARAGEYPFDSLQQGMPVLLGAGWLSLEAAGCSFDFMNCALWDPHINRPADLDEELVRANALWLGERCQHEGLRAVPELEPSEGETILALTERLCGRGPGLTPGGDDFLAGWLAAGRLLYGSHPAFFAIGQHVVRIARTRTHTLSQCWLTYAAAGDVARPVSELLAALATPDRGRLVRAASDLLTLGATSGFDLLRGILYCLTQPPVLA